MFVTEVIQPNTVDPWAVTQDQGGDGGAHHAHHLQHSLSKVLAPTQVNAGQCRIVPEDRAEEIIRHPVKVTEAEVM